MRSLPGCLFLALSCVTLVEGGSIQATTLIVTTTADSGAGSLRQAVLDANDGDTIEFDPALNGQTIALTSNELVINKDIVIDGLGPNSLAVSRTSSLRFSIFHIMYGHAVTIAGLVISGGNADGPAGGIANEGSLTIDNCIVSNNFSDGSGGGGILSVGTLTILNSVVTSNLVASTTFPKGSGGGIYAAGELTIINSAICNNTAADDGGGIFFGGGKITITSSTISGNRAGSDAFQFTGNGGGLHVDGTIEIRTSTISGNIASGEDSGWGGGIVVGSSGSATITESTISGNLADQNGGGIVSGGPLTIFNSTVSGNFANQNGGGIVSGGLLIVTCSTISGNTAASGGGIANFTANGILRIGNTILKAGSGGNVANDNGGTVTSLGYNLSSDNGGGFLTAAGDQININPILGPLQDNGGPTFTHLPQTGSPAIDAGNPDFTPPPLYDQRGYPRIFNGRIDIGSVEVQPTSPTPSPTPTGTPSPTATPTASPTASPGFAQALNISTRLRVETGDNLMIGGFILTGNWPKNVAVRGIGPSLAGSGISDALADPILELRAANGVLLFQNDNWEDDPAQAAQLIALGLAPTDPRESGTVATVQPGAYTVIVAGKDETTGIGLVEIYDTNPKTDSELANISTRGFVETEDNVMIGGFILGGGAGSAAIAVRGIGPSLSQIGLNNVLADPTLELRDTNGALLASNDNWQDDPASAGQLTAHGLAPQNSLESGIFASLPPGAFTAILAGKNNGTGIGLLEIYNVQ